MTDILSALFDLLLHVDQHIDALIDAYGIFTHAILFIVIFVETGLVIMPFLPGDSLLFAAGAFAGKGTLDLPLLLGLLSVAAIVGDSVNYWVGAKTGRRVFTAEHPLINKKYLVRAQEFYDRHGEMTIIIARFVPIVRTFAPFLAGVASMRYSKFLAYNITGGLLWVFSLVLAGYFLGGMPIVEENFTLVIYLIIATSILPGVIEFLRAKFRRKNDLR